VVAPYLEFNTVSDTPRDSLTMHDLSLPLDSLGELEEGDGFETYASSDDQCGIFIESGDTFPRSIHVMSLLF